MSRDDNVGIGRGDEEGIGAEIFDIVSGGFDGVLELLALRGGDGGGQAGLQCRDTGFALGDEGVRVVAAFGPLVAGQRLEGLRIGVHAGDAVAVGAVAIDIHVRLNPEDLARGCGRHGGRLEFEDRFAIVEIVAGEDLVEAEEILLDRLDFVPVKPLVKRGDLGGFEPLPDLWEEGGERGIESGQTSWVVTACGMRTWRSRWRL